MQVPPEEAGRRGPCLPVILCAQTVGYDASYSNVYSLNKRHEYKGSMARAEEYYELTLSWDPMSSTMSYTYRGQGGSEVIDPTIYFGDAAHVRAGLFGAKLDIL